MFKSLNSIIFILLILVFVYFIKKHYLVKKLEENYQNLKQGHLLLTPINPKDKKNFVLLQRSLISKEDPLLKPSLVPKKNKALTEKKITTSNLNQHCSNKLTSNEKKTISKSPMFSLFIS